MVHNLLIMNTDGDGNYLGEEILRTYNIIPAINLVVKLVNSDGQTETSNCPVTNHC